jgi:hypothetical protein
LDVLPKGDLWRIPAGKCGEGQAALTIGMLMNGNIVGAIVMTFLVIAI